MFDTVEVADDRPAQVRLDALYADDALFRHAVLGGSKLYTVRSNRLVCRGNPTREERIAEYMTVPNYVCSKNDAGHAIQTGPTFATRAEAERACP